MTSIDSDRERILVQLMTSVWETILQDCLSCRGRAGPRSFAAKCAATMHGRETEALTEAEVRAG